MRKTFCDKCGKEITEDVTMVFNHELCSECAKAVDDFITCSTRPCTMNDLRDFCEHFNKGCKECPFCDDKDGVCGGDCGLVNYPCNWPSEPEVFIKLLDYKVNNPDWRKKE